MTQRPPIAFPRAWLLALAVALLPSPLLAGWTFTYSLTIEGVCPGAFAPPLPPIPALIPDQATCEALRAQIDAITETGCTNDGCCTLGYAVGACTFSADTGNTGGTGNFGLGQGGEVILTQNDFLGSGNLLRESIVERLAGGYHNLGDVSALGTSNGDAFFTPHYTLSTNDWIEAAMGRWQAYLSQNQELRERFASQSGPGPHRALPSPFADALSNLPATQAYENTVLDEFQESGIRINGSTPALLRPGGPLQISADPSGYAAMSGASLAAAEREAAQTQEDTSMESGLASAAMSLPQGSITAGANRALEAGGEAALGRLAGETPEGAPEFGDGLAIGKIAMKLDEGNYAGAGAEAINWGIGKIPLPGIAIAQAGGEVVSGTAKEALLGAFTQINTAMGSETPRADAEKFFNDTISDMPPGQRTVAEWLGWGKD